MRRCLNELISQMSDCTLWHSGVTCKHLTQASEVEKSSLGHREQLTQEHQEGDGGEDHRQDHQDLHCLEPLWGNIRTCTEVVLAFRYRPDQDKTSLWNLTGFLGGCTQPRSCEVVKPTVVPEVRVLHALPLPPGLQREIRTCHTQQDVCALRLTEPNHAPNMIPYLLHGGDEQHRQGNEVKQGHEHEQVCHFAVLCSKQRSTHNFTLPKWLHLILESAGESAPVRDQRRFQSEILTPRKLSLFLPKDIKWKI